LRLDHRHHALLRAARDRRPRSRRSASWPRWPWSWRRSRSGFPLGRNLTRATASCLPGAPARV